MKIAIVGGGINGLYLAWKLSEKNHDVSVFERKNQIGDNIVCSGLFSERILNFIPRSQNLVKNRINYVLIHFPKKTIRVHFSKDFFLIEHSRLDQLVAELAQKSGAKIFLGQNISQIPENFDRIIGCDGANSFVRRSLGLKEPKYKLGFLSLTEARPLQNCRGRASNFVEVWPDKTGFSWKIPKGGENTEYGAIKELGSFDFKGTEFLKVNKAKIIPQGLIIPNHSSITLCGDAAGLTKPWSGGGVIWGLFAADILLKTFPDFKKYRKLIIKFFLPKIIISKLGRKSIYFIGFKIPWLLPKNSRIESDFLL